MDLTIKSAKVGESWLAVTELGGIKVRGKRADSELLAVRNLLWKLGEADEDDAALGLELALSGQTLDQLSLGAGDGD